jgi:shikimate dehydrogenase
MKLNMKKCPIIRTIPIESVTLQTEINDTQLLVNASPIGMAPEYIGKSPLDNLNVQLSSRPFVFDAVYNPMDTKFLIDARKAGCKTLGGIYMLVNQGAIAFEWWTGVKSDTQLMTEAAIKKLNIKR